jgi:hypothetical protein
MTQVAVDDGLMKRAETLSTIQEPSKVVEKALQIYIDQLNLKSMFGTMKDDDFWDTDEGKIVG